MQTNVKLQCRRVTKMDQSSLVFYRYSPGLTSVKIPTTRQLLGSIFQGDYSSYFTYSEFGLLIRSLTGEYFSVTSQYYKDKFESMEFENNPSEKYLIYCATHKVSIVPGNILTTDLGDKIVRFNEMKKSRDQTVREIYYQYEDNWNMVQNIFEDEKENT